MNIFDSQYGVAQLMNEHEDYKRHKKLNKEYSHQTFTNPYSGMPEAFAQGVYEAPGELARLADMVANSSLPGMLSSMYGYKSNTGDKVDELTGVDELNYNPEDYEGLDSLKTLARFGGNVVGDPLNAIPGGYMAGKFGKELGGEIVNQSLKPGMSKQAGMVGYHGSPHKFDKFDHSKMGTGEGAQAYGWGTYIAEDGGVAKSYYDDFADLGERTNVDGSTYERLKGMWRKDGKQAPTDIDLALDSLRDVKWDKDSAIKDLELYIKNEKEFSGAKKIIGEDIHIGQAFYTEDEVQSAINRIKASEFEKTPEAYMYEVDLPDEKIAQMLDWDAPLSEQPESVRDIVNQILQENPDNMGLQALNKYPDTMRGEQVYERIVGMRGAGALDGDQAASELMSEYGIPGIKYFDGSSRSAGEGTRNFVVFDEADMSILSRNGEKALPAGLLGYNTIFGDSNGDRSRN